MDQKSLSLTQIWRRNPLPRWSAALGLIAGLAAIFSALAEDVWFQEGFAWDAPIIMAIHSLSRPWLDTLMRSVTLLGAEGAIVVAGATIGWIMWRRRPLDAATVAVSFVGGVIINLALKMVFARPRPALFAPLVEQRGFSFPSGHVATSVTVYGLLAVYLWRSGQRAWAGVVASIMPGVAFSRIYLGVHYPSDTLASFAYVTLWVWAVFSIRDRHARRTHADFADAPPREESRRVVQ